MDIEIKKALREEILAEFEKLKKLDPSSEEYAKVVSNLDTMCKLSLEKTHDKSDEFIKWLKVALDVLAVGGPLVLYAVFLGRGFRFEESGSYTSKTFMNLINRFKPTM